jgi:hypothetical protein
MSNFTKCGMVILATVLVLPAVMVAGEMHGGECPHCAGQVGYHDVVSHVCRTVPDKKQIKKTVYEVKEVPFCLHKLPPLFGHHGECCDECRECGCVRYKKVLLKKEIVCDEICTTKCVVEKVVERVPCRTCCPACPNYQAASPAMPVAEPLADQELVPIPLPVGLGPRTVR